MNPWAEFAEKLERLKTKAFCRLAYRENKLLCVVGVFIPEYTDCLVRDSQVCNLRFSAPKVVIEGEGGNIALWEDKEMHAEAQALLCALLEKRTGLDPYQLKQIQALNDQFDGTPEARYEHVLQHAWKLAQQKG